MKPDRFAKTKKDSLGNLLLEGAEREDTLVRALQECQAAVDAHRPIDREAMLAKYPGIRDELSACLDGMALIQPLKSGGNAEPSAGDGKQFSSHLTPAATLGDFRIQRELGRGGMGVVYEAEQLSVGRKVALKVLPYAAMLDKRQVARFQNEARAAATLEHPRIVPVYFVGNERGVYYYAMKLIDGKNLSEVMLEIRHSIEKSQNPVPLSQVTSRLTEPRSLRSHNSKAVSSAAETLHDPAAFGETSYSTDNGSRSRVYYESIARLGKQIADALDFAHTHGIVHRDVKPANIMLDEVGDAWITDFGLARIEADGGMTMTGDLVGTLRYMSPEQTLAKRVTVDHRSDVYSLGATLYELIALKPLFEGEDRAELLQKIAFENPRPLSKVATGVPHDLETVLLKSLQKNPEDRYGSAKEMADDLQRYLQYKPVHARRTPVTRRFTLWAQRHPQRASTIALAGLLTVVLAVGVPQFFAQRRAQQQAQKLANQTQELADAIAARAATHEYFATVSEIREQSILRPAGWTWDALDRIRNAAHLEADGKDFVQLRSLAASALTSIDVKVIQEFAEGIDAGAVAVSRDGRFFAIGEVRPAGNAASARVLVFRIDGDKQRVSMSHEFALPVEKSLFSRIYQRTTSGPEGVRSLAFSNGGSQLAIGTRYGQILEWEFATNSSRQIVSAKPTENERVVFLSYSPNGKHLVACVNGRNELKIIDPSERDLPAWSTPRKGDFFAFTENGLLYESANRVVVEVDDLANPQSRERSIKQVASLASTPELDVSAVITRTDVGGSRASLLDTRTVYPGMPLHALTSVEKVALKSLGFGPNAQSLVAIKDRNSLRVWDALSGHIAFEVPKHNVVDLRYTVATPSDLATVSGAAKSSLYRWREPPNLAQKGSLARHGNSAVVKNFAPSAWPIHAFDLSQDGENIAILEDYGAKDATIRVRKFSLHNAKELQRWSLCGDTYGPSSLRTRGRDLLYTLGGNVICASREIGIPLVLSANGIGVPAGLSRPLTTAEPRTTEKGHAVYEFPAQSLARPPYDRLIVGFSFRLKSSSPALSGKKPGLLSMKIEVDGEDAPLTRGLFTETFTSIGMDQWQTLLVASVENTRGPIRLTVHVSPSNSAEDIVMEAGEGVLMAVLRDGQPQYWLGPLSTQGNGTIVSVDNGNTLTRSSSPYGAPEWRWSDSMNEFATIRAVASAENSTVIGTRWGHVYLVDAQDNVKQINRVGLSSGGDVAEEVASVAIDRLGRVAASGSLEGKITLFDLEEESPGVEIQAHQDAITALALHRNGSLLASGGEDSLLKIWKTGRSETTLLFELKLHNPITEMKFSPANACLFVLCRGERGIRIFDMHAMQQEFAALGVGWHD